MGKCMKMDELRRKMKLLSNNKSGDCIWMKKELNKISSDIDNMILNREHKQKQM